VELEQTFRLLHSVHREILVLIFFEELSYQEAAHVLEIPVGTIKSRLSNARRALRALLQAREDATK
jgi:RNA polymerase sigma-70 factor (ECF subfamily)